MMILSVTIANDQIQPGALGIVESSFQVITPGVEWEFLAAPLFAPPDLAGALGGLSPVLWVDGPAGLGFAVRFLVGISPGVRLRIVGPDWITPILVPGVSCGARLFRNGPTS